jgi:hypothetical protein
MASPATLRRVAFRFVDLTSGPRATATGGSASSAGSASPMAQLRLGLGQEDAIEMYYNASFAPWFSAASGARHSRPL